MSSTIELCHNFAMELFTGLFAGLFFTTFVLEDVALASAILFVAENKITFWNAFFACFLGISIGDLLLYGLGRLTHLSPRLKNISYLKRAVDFLSQSQAVKKMDFAVVISRVLPGTRLPTYVGAGLIKYSFLRFFILTFGSVAAWVLGSLLIGESLQSVFLGHPFLALLLFFVVLLIFKKAVFYWFNKWERRAARYKWRQWLHFEFWPAWFFYLPIVPTYIYHSLRTGSFIHPFYANPLIFNGGLVGESKWDFLKHLDPNHESTLPHFYFQKTATLQDLKNEMERLKINMPFVLKPDVGQRGFGVRIIKTLPEAEDYLKKADFDIILQQKSSFYKEAGLFYIRPPQSNKGFVFSVTLKEFPFVIGDGKLTLGQLILNDPRARIIAQVYFDRHREQLESILPKDHSFVLSECGNHCQGAVFLNGHFLISEKLTQAVDAISKTLPHFYFGRLDIRYKSDEDLKEGKNFHIIEINGAGSEATHIWDKNTTLYEAYSTLFKQWTYLFDVGRAVRKLHPDLGQVRVSYFFKDFGKMTSRKHNLSVSS